MRATAGHKQPRQSAQKARQTLGANLGTSRASMVEIRGLCDTGFLHSCQPAYRAEQALRTDDHHGNQQRINCEELSLRKERLGKSIRHANNQPKIGAHREERAMRQIEDIHQSENQRQAHSKQKDQHAELKTIQKLKKKELHTVSRRSIDEPAPWPWNPPENQNGSEGFGAARQVSCACEFINKFAPWFTVCILDDLN